MSGRRLPAVLPARAQTRADGFEGVVGPERARRVVALVGTGLKAPRAARDTRLRPGRAGAVCGEVDVVDRIGDHVGPRGFVTDPAAGLAGILPGAAGYTAMERILAPLSARCWA